MPILLLLLLLGVLAYFLWRHKTSNLSRTCRWREERKNGCWRCASCGATSDGL